MKLPGYYDKPEGQDIVGKLIATNKHAFIIGSTFGLYDVVMYSKKLRGFQPNAGRWLYFTAPCVGMATTFTTATYAANRIRGKDDTLNYVIGAYAAGGIVGCWRKSSFWGWAMGSVFAMAGILKKMSLNEGWTFFVHDLKPCAGEFRDIKRDWSLFAEREKGWVPAPKELVN